MKKFLTLNSIYRFSLIFSSLLLVISARGQVSHDNTFNSTDRGGGFGDGPNGAVKDIKVQPDGKVLILGDFTTYNGVPRRGLVRLRGDSQGFDSTFLVGSGFSGGTGPLEMVLQPDGKMIVVGSFTAYNGISANGVIRLNSDGSVDDNFSVGVGSPSVTTVELLTNGQILVAGSFATFAGINRGLVARLSPNGSVDLAFDAGFGGFTLGFIKDIAIQSDGKVLVAGQFPAGFNGASLNLASVSSPAILLRLKNYGPLDPTFLHIRTTGSFGVINSVKLVAGDKIIVGGKFTGLLGLNTTSSSNLAQVYSSGLVDVLSVSVVAAPTQNEIDDILIQENQIIATGSFRKLGGLKRGRIARFLANGSIDAAFAPDSGANGPILATAVDETGRILVGGLFSRFDQKGRNNLARLSANGTIDSPFSLNTGADSPIYDVAVQSDRKTLIAGQFGYFNWNSANGIARLLPTGQYDPSFITGTGINGVVRCVAIQSDGKILLGGQFDSYNNVQRKGLVRLLSNGSLDPSFNAGTSTTATVYSIAIQSDGKILAGGDFTSFATSTSSGIVRLNSNGSIDLTFHPGVGFNGSVRSIALLRDSLIFVGGSFTTVQGTSRAGIARLQMDGDLDDGFNSGAGLNPGGSVYSIAIQSDKKIVFGGSFTSYNGNPILNVARMSPTGTFDPNFNPGLFAEGPVYDMLVDSHQRIVVVGQFEGKAIGRNGIVRLKPSGSKDNNFGSGSGANGGVSGIDDDPSGGFLIAGDFTSFDDDARNRVARLNDSLITVTTWNGSDWDFGRPDDDPVNLLHCIIDGDYDNSNSGYVCDDLFINSGRVFEPNSDVEVRGNALSNSTLTGGRIVMNSAGGTQSFEGYVNDLTIDNALNVSLNGPTWLKGTLKLQSGYLATNDVLTLVSNAAGTARVSKVESGAGITGEVNVQRYVEGGVAGWHFMGTPVQYPAQTQADWSDDFTILYNSMFRHNEGGLINSGDQMNGWEYFSGDVEVGKGYRVWLNQIFFNGGATFDNKGSIVTGPFSFPLTYTPAGYGGGGWNMVANPYPCEIDWDLVYPSQASGLNGELHMWNDVGYSSYAGGIHINGGLRYIPANQGFFVKATGSGASLSMSEDSKPTTTQSNSMLRVATLPEDACRITLMNTDGKTDEMVLRSRADASHAFDAPLDAHKLLNPRLNLYSLLQDGTKTCIQARPVEESSDFQLGYSVPTEGEYQMKVEMGSEFRGSKTWYLRNNLEGTLEPLAQNSLLTFNALSGSLSSDLRFNLVGYSSATDVPTQQKQAKPLISRLVRDEVVIWNASNLNSVTITDLTGKVVLETKSGGHSQEKIQVGSLASGLYHVQLHTKTKVLTERMIKQ